MVGKYKVITLCGSTRFKDASLEVQKRLTLEGDIVINVGGYIGESTRLEIEYSRKNGKEVRYLEESMVMMPDETVREIAEMLDCGYVCYLNPDTNETVFTLNPDSWQYYGVSDEDSDLLDKVDSWERCIKLTPPESFESFKFMEGFVDELPESESSLRSKLISALSNNHPFARFKAVVDSCPYRQEWFAYKQRCLEAYVREAISM